MSSTLVRVEEKRPKIEWLKQDIHLFLSHVAVCGWRGALGIVDGWASWSHSESWGPSNLLLHHSLGCGPQPHDWNWLTVDSTLQPI